MKELLKPDLDVKYFNILEQWAQRIKMATICCNDELIRTVVSEIKMFYWLSESETLEDKIERYTIL